MDDLSTEVFAAIRDHHTTFGSLVSKRLPLCIPPRTDTPELYTLGISRFAEIYFAFESAWLSQLAQLPTVSGSGSPDEYEILDSFVNDDKGRIRSILSQLYIPELLRSDKLRADLIALGWSPEKDEADKILPDGSYESDGNNTAHENAATAFAAYIKAATDDHPHLIMVYAWIMYLALLNGGRRIRTKLAAAGHDFWNSGPTTPTPASTARDESAKTTGIPNGLSFWFFHRDDNDLYDDEGIKQEFKQRLHSASNLLTVTERAQIIAEAVNIFRQCSRIVAEIDVEVARAGSGSGSGDRVRSGSRSGSASGILPSIKAKLPFASGLLRRQGDSAELRVGGMRLRSILVGAAGLLGGLLAWVLAANGEMARDGFAAWRRGNETEG
ncbi:heme oxygenase [Emmonsiellopsis sp. PD_33]|nr:heme oxygenase [Emmonsiellopsis sp. PD_33]